MKINPYYTKTRPLIIRRAKKKLPKIQKAQKMRIFGNLQFCQKNENT